MVAVTGVETLLTPLGMLSWHLAILILVPGLLLELAHTVAWRLAFVGPRVSPGRLFAVRLAGEAVNFGGVSVAGEPLKVYLLRPSVSVMDAAVAQIVDKTSVTAAQVLFLAVGLLIVRDVALPADFVRAMTVLLGAQVLVVGGFVVVQCVELGDGALGLLARFGLETRGGRDSTIRRFGRVLGAFYRERFTRVLACTGVHLLGWLAGGLEVYLMLRWLDVNTSLTTALALDAFGTGIRFLAFAIPGALGVLEGGYMAVFAIFGVGGGLGLSFSLVRRLRMLAWAAAGLVILATLLESRLSFVARRSPGFPARRRS